MRGLTLLLPAAVLLALTDAARQLSIDIQADTTGDSSAVWAEGRLQHGNNPRPACPMPVQRGNQAGRMPNFTPPPPPAPADSAAPRDSSYRRAIPIPAPFMGRLRDRMPVARSGCWNPLFSATAWPDTWIVIPAPR